MKVALAAALTPASAELRFGTAQDRVGDVLNAGVPASDIVQVDARYDTTAGDLVVDVTMAGDVAPRLEFDVNVRTQGATGCDGYESVRIVAASEAATGTWFASRTPTEGAADVRPSGRHIAFRARGSSPAETAALQSLDLDCVTVSVRSPTRQDMSTYFLQELGVEYDHLDQPLYLGVAPPKQAPVKAKRCPTVSLRGKTLKAAEKALAKAGCSVGTVKEPKGRGTLVVKRAGAADVNRRVDLVLKIRR